MPEEEYTSPLGRALAIWATGRPISMTLAVALMADGFDVPTLERKHKKG